MLRNCLSYLLLFLVFCSSLSAQPKNDTDSLVRLLGCDELRQVEDMGRNVRKAIGNARFQHNGTLLVCDTAFWYIDDSLINAIGNVRIIQDETILTGEKLTYLVNRDLAQFRGALVQLQDKKVNTLRTNNLDYNTKDSVAVFRDGGSFKDEDGQIIEGDVGTYDSKIKTFFFNGNVNMFTDSIFIKTTHLEYDTEQNIATFGRETNAWQKRNMLSSDAGWYNRNEEIFLFNDNVHLLTAEQEAWADTLKYYRTTSDAEMFGNVQVLDTTRNVTSVAGYMNYCDSLSRLVLQRDPAVIYEMEQESERDTVYMGADKLVYWTEPKCALSDEQFSMAKSRLKDMTHDAIGAYRQKAARDAAAKAEETRRKMLEEDPNAFNSIDRGAAEQGDDSPSSGKGTDNDKPEEEPDPEAIRIAEVRDSLMRLDSIAFAKTDSTKIGFVLALNNVKLFKSDIQMSCDSLEYNDLDSLIRLYLEPAVWNESNRQYTADSISLMIKNQTFDRASLMSNAFIAVQEDSVCYDQIKATDMMAYFDTSGTLKRFDAMGNVAGVFYLEENNTLATVNKFEAKMLTANFRDGEISDLDYFEAVKSDAYPVVQMTRDERFLKDYKWLPERRPERPSDVTTLVPRTSRRSYYENIPHAAFKHTEKYFPGYMDDVHEMLVRSDSLRRVRNMQKDSLDRAEALKKDSVALAQRARLDSLSRVIALGLDTLKVSEADTLLTDTLLAKTVAAVTDSISSKKDSIQTSVSNKESAIEKPVVDKVAEKAERRAKLKAEKAARKKERLERLERKDAQVAAAKSEKEQARLRKKNLKTLKALDKRQAEEQKMLDKYKARYEKRLARKQGSVETTS